MNSEQKIQRALIYHGYTANPSDHWFGWLAQQLTKHGIETEIPALPSPLAPRPKQWERCVQETLGVPNEHTAVVAHSLGCLTVLRYLNSLHGPWRLGVLVLVGGFVEPLPTLPALDDYIGQGWDAEGLHTLKEIRSHIDRVIIIRSDNDDTVPPIYTDNLAAKFGLPVHIVANAGHFVARQGITRLPAVLEAILASEH